jgi:GTP-binding protein EngB required for normal cell division
MSNDLDAADLSGCIDAGAQCLVEAWPDGHPALSALHTLRERLQEARLQIAILGQFKRGKSTFINALLRAPLLPSAVVPVTAVPTFIAWGPEPHIRVSYQDTRPSEDFRPPDPAAIRAELDRWVTEEGNPVNRRKVRRVDLFFPADMLRDGMVLIDTPGVGSTLRHNTDAALQVLPECDAALFVVSADPPVTETEISYLRAIRPHVVRLNFVLNKIDYLNGPEQEQAIGFLRNVPRGSLGLAEEPQIFPLSARDALQAATEGNSAALEATGLRRIERDLLRPLRSDKLIALRASVAVKAKMLLEQGLVDLSLQRRALELPLDDLERRMRKLEEELHDTECERQMAHDMLAGDKRRAVEKLESQAEALREEALRKFRALIQLHVQNNRGILDRTAIQRSLDTELPDFFAAKLMEFAAGFRQLVEAVLSQQQQRADALIASVRVTTASLFDIALPPQGALEPFRLGPEPYWVSEKLVHALIPSPLSLLRRLLPGAMRQQYLRRLLEEKIADLVLRNVEGLRWSTLRGLDDTFRRFAGRLDERLTEAVAATQGSVHQVLERRRNQAGQTATELPRLNALEARLRAVVSGLTLLESPAVG